MDTGAIATDTLTLLTSYAQTITASADQLRQRLNDQEVTARLFKQCERLLQQIKDLAEAVSGGGYVPNAESFKYVSDQLPRLRTSISSAKSYRELENLIAKASDLRMHIERIKSRPATPINETSTVRRDLRQGLFQLPTPLVVNVLDSEIRIESTAFVDSGTDLNLVSRAFLDRLQRGNSLTRCTTQAPRGRQMFPGWLVRRRTTDLVHNDNFEQTVELKVVFSDPIQRELILPFIVHPSTSAFTSIILGRTVIPLVLTHDAESAPSDESAKTIKNSGLVPITKPRRTAVVDVIFVHGFKGNSQTTWTGICGAFWPEAFLADDLQDAALWRYDYNANISMQAEDGPLIREIVEKLSDDLIEAVDSATERPIIWVCHGLGGLLVKSALTRSEKLGRTSKQRNPIFHRCLGILFIDTPHSASSLGTRASIFNLIMSASSGPSSVRSGSQESLPGEKRLDSAITTITIEFAKLMSNERFPIMSLFDTDMMITEKGPRKLVTFFHRLGHPQERVDLLEGNHLTMVRFDTREERGYQRILKMFQMLVSGEAPELPKSPDPTVKVPTLSGRTSETDVESTDIEAMYDRLRLKLDLPSTRWQSVRKDASVDADWIRDSSYIKEWLEDKQRRPLVIIGPVGCGKTVIAESLLAMVRQNSTLDNSAKDICQLQWFFRSDQIGQQTPTDLLESLMAQTLDQNRELFPIVQRDKLIGDSKKKKSYRAGLPASVASSIMTGTLKLMLEDTCWKSVYIVIDALDECHPRYAKEVLRIISALSQVTCLRMALTFNLDAEPSFSLEPPAESEADGNWMRRWSQSLNAIRFELLKDYSKSGWRAQVERHIERRVADTLANTPLSKSQLSEFSRKLKSLPQLSYVVVDLILEHTRASIPPKAEIDSWFAQQIKDLKGRGELYYALTDLKNDLKDGKTDSGAIVLSILALVFEPLRVQDIAMLMQYRDDQYTSANGDIYAHGRTQKLQQLFENHNMQQLVRVDGLGVHLKSDMVRRVVLDDLEVSGQLSTHQMLAQASVHIILSDHMFQQFTPLFIPGKDYALKHWKDHYLAAGKPANEMSDGARAWIHQQEESNKSLHPNTASSASAGSVYLVGDLKSSRLGPGHGAELDVNEYPTAENVEQDIYESTLDVMMQSYSKSPGSDEKFSYEKVVDALDVYNSSPERGRQAIEAALGSFGTWNRKYETFIRDAITEGNHHDIRCLLGIVNEPPESKSVLLQFAVLLSQTSPQIIQAMLRRIQIFNVDSAFSMAACRANHDLCEELLQHGAKIEAKYGEKESTRLHEAAMRGDCVLVQKLLKWNASVNVRDSKLRTPLHRAATNGHADIVDVLVANSASLDATDRYQRTPLFSACARGHRQTVLRLWRAGSQLSHRDKDGRTMMHAAAHTGHLTIVDMLLSAGLPPSAEDKSGKTACHEAAANGWSPIVERLLRAGANPNARDKQGRSVLHYASKCRNSPETVIYTLLQWGADPLVREGLPDKNNNNKDVCQDKDCSQADKDHHLSQRTLLHFAAEYSTLRAVHLLVTKIPQLVELKDAHGNGVLDFTERDTNPLDRADKLLYLRNHFKHDQIARGDPYEKSSPSGTVAAESSSVEPARPPTPRVVISLMDEADAAFGKSRK